MTMPAWFKTLHPARHLVTNIMFHDHIVTLISTDRMTCKIWVTQWQNLTGKRATLQGDSRTFDQIAEERQATRIYPCARRGTLRQMQAGRGLATVAPLLAHVRSRGDGLACWPRRP